MANEDTTNNIALPMAFTAADDIGFQLLFSFAYAGNGPWDKSVFIDLIKEYGAGDTYFKNGGSPFVSTFEGPNNADDWKDIKKETDYGLFSWDGWPKGTANMTTYPDASYYDFLGSKPYIIPIFPWFYTSLPAYDKNCLWRGDDMWFHLWQQAISLDRQPDFIQIISWNDYGESHYIGPLDDRQYEPFDIGRAPFNYVSMYKSETASITEECLVAWYRVNKNGACSDGGTTGNTANQLQFEYSANAMMEDRVFYDVLLTSNAQVQVSIGGVGGSTIATIMGASITSSCNGGLNNYNSWVGSASGPSITPVKTTGELSKLDCVKGFGVFEFTDVCDFACANGYCRCAACACLEKGVANAPNDTGLAGYPLPGKSGSFAGPCSFNCNHGYCPDSAPARLSTTASSWATRLYCRPHFGCHLGFCPIHACACTSTGILVQTPAMTDVTRYYLDSSADDYGLCKFACEHGYYPNICGSRPIGETAPAAQCAPLCPSPAPVTPRHSDHHILYRWRTSLEFGWKTTDTVNGAVATHYTAVTVTTDISIPPVTTDLISFSEAILTTTVHGDVPSIIIPTVSVSPSPFVITPTTIADISGTPVSRTFRPPPWPWSAASAMPDPSGTSTTTSTSGPVTDIPTATGTFPTTVFPTETVSWVRDWVPEPTASQMDGSDPAPVVPCWAWFIWSCPPNVGEGRRGGRPDSGASDPSEGFQRLNKRAATTTTSTISFCTQVTGCGASDITSPTSLKHCDD
ncbi:glycosyl hydrolase family 71-domain-containing protein [Aspergillus californicus]